MKNYHNISSNFVQYGYCCTIEPLKYLYGWILVDIGSFLFHVTHIQCLGDYRMVGNGSTPINMNNFHNILLPSCEVWILLSHRYFDIFLGKYLSRYTTFYLSLIVFGVLVIIKQQENGSGSINMKNYHNIFYRLVWYGYCSPIDPLVIFWVNIGLDTPISISRYSYLVSW